MKRKLSLITVILIFLMLLLNVFQPVGASGNAWFETWHHGAPSGLYENYPGYPQNISVAQTLYSADGNYWIQIALVVSIYQYEPYYADDMVTFRGVVYFDSFAREGLYPVVAQHVSFLIDKDTSGSNLGDQAISVEETTTPPGYSQGHGLTQWAVTGSTYDQRVTLGLEALGFAVGVFFEPVGIATGLISLAYAFAPSEGTDFDNADWNEMWARIWWFNPGYDFGEANPVRQYAFSSIRWFQRNQTPDTYYGITVRASIMLPTGNPFNIGNIITSPVYLSINREGCPYVSVWNGSGYVLDNNLLGCSEVSNGADVKDYCRLEQTLVPRYVGTWFSQYSLLISEFEDEHSYIDQVKLLAVDHSSNVNVAVSPTGEILTYQNPSPPVSAVDNYGNNWLNTVSNIDNNYYRGCPDEYLLLDFGSLNVSQAAKLVLRANIEFKKDECIHVQTLNETCEWTDAAILRTRYHWSTIIADLADYLPNPDDTLKMRLYFTGIHKIDYVGLDTTPQADITTIQTNAFSAIHSTQGGVTLKLLLNDQKYAELLPGEQIELKFILPNTQKTRTFIIYTEGHYETI